MLKEYYISIAKSYGSPRIRETVVAIAKMIARLKLKSIVDVEDTRETMQFYNVILLQLEQVVNITTDPRDEAFEECIEVLKKSPFALSFSDLLKSACQNNEQVKGYIGDRYTLEHNHKLRPILDLLLNHNHIVQANLKPVALHWVETEKEKIEIEIEIEIESNNLLSDVSDVYDIDQRAAGKNFSHGSIPKEGNIVIDSGDKFQEESGRTLKNNSQGHSSLASDRSDMSDAKPTLLESKPTITSAYSCYYCNDFQTNNQYEYERHVVSKHMLSPSDVNHLFYPCKLDLERLGLKAQRKNWEI